MEFKIIATIGPSSNKHDILERLKDRGASFFRINLSHTEEDEVELKIKELIGYNIPVILDTEGSQVRSGNSQEIFYNEGGEVKVHEKKVDCDSNNLFLTPTGIIKLLNIGDLISIDFNSLLLRVFDKSTLNLEYIKCKVLIEGKIGGKKAVQIDSPAFNLPFLSNKDYLAIQLAKKYKIRHFTLSFTESKKDVELFRKIYPGAILYSKIESKKGLDNFLEIAKASDGILIDRGDLSNQVPLEKIPLIQKFILKNVRNLGKEAFVATNTLEQMSFSLKPNMAEVNDIINTILDGATGIALTKETAVGQYPVETLNMIKTLINQVKFINNNKGKSILSRIEKSNYLYGQEYPELLEKPHGGSLVNRLLLNFPINNIPKKNIEIDENSLIDIGQIANGAFSPLDGFMKSKDFYSVLNDMRLNSGVVWPIPIVLRVNKNITEKLKEGEELSLTFKGEVYGILHLEEIYKINKAESSLKIYGTLDTVHPGVKKFLEDGEYLLGGKIRLIKIRDSPNSLYELSPRQTRKIFAERGWSKVLGFHTRNVIHRSHEFIQLEGLKISLCDGLLIHPIAGKKKSGDFETEIIINSYEKMMEHFYPKSKILFSVLTTYPRYAGPREALFTALVKKNFGCSHFIVGRDHTGVEHFYKPESSYEIFDKFEKEEIGIVPIKFNNVFYSALENRYIHESEFTDYPEDQKMYISETVGREILKAGKTPPEWFMRPEISELILKKIKSGEKVFVD